MDSQSYQEASVLLMKGEIDVFRTPCYPMVIAVCQLLTSSNSYNLLIGVQILIFYLSLYGLYWVMRRLKIVKIMAVIVCAIYALAPIVLMAQLFVMTESLAMSCSVFFIACFVKWQQDGRWIDVILVLLCALFLLFLRPAFLYMLVALVVIVAMLFKRKDYQRGAQLCSVVIVSVSLMFGYCKLIESKTGIFTPSTVSIANKWMNAFKIGKVTPENITDPLIREKAMAVFQEGNGEEYPALTLYLSFSPTQIDRELRAMERKDKLLRVKSFYVNCSQTMKNIGTYGGYRFDFRLVYLLLLCVALYFSYNMLHGKKNSLLLFFLWLMCMGNIFVLLWSGFAEWCRLFLPSLPLLLVLVAMVCSSVKINSINKNCDVSHFW